MKRFFFVLILLVSTSAPATAQSVSKLSDALTQRIEMIAKKDMEENKIPGMSVAVAHNGELQYSMGFGSSDLENSVPTKPDTRFRTASIAKSITACAVLQLYEQGKIDLDAPIQNYCPEFPEKRWPITVRQLLGHLGGVRHYNKPDESTGKKFFPTLTESLDLFKNDPLLHEPGTRFSYTTFGYTLLGCAIEKASGMSYEDYLKKNIFQPAGMNSTQLDHVRTLIPNRARGYVMMDQRNHDLMPEVLKLKFPVGGIYNATLHDTSMKVPGGGLVSTSGDLVKFVVALNANKLVKEKTREMMWTRQKTQDGKMTSYGLGWAIEQDEGGPRLISHSGGQAGTSTFLVTIPQARLSIAVMGNLQGVRMKNIVRQIGAAVFQDVNDSTEQ